MKNNLPAGKAGEIKIVVKKGEEKVVPFVWINGKETHVVWNARLVGEGSSVHLVGIFLGDNASSVKFDTLVTHEASHTISKTTIRGVFRDRSSFDNDGMIRINKGAVASDGFFASKVLLFDNAKGRSVPSLEIDENDLKAGHASTIGRPDEDQLFYLRSKGLTEKEALELIVSGFFEPALSLLPHRQQKIVRRHLASRI